MYTSDYLLEKRLKELDPGLHKRFTDSMSAILYRLDKFQLLFPEYTDHSEFHVLNVINFCNILIGQKHIEDMNADEIYVLLMSCYLHDIGMAITEKDYEEFKDQLGAEEYFRKYPDRDVPDFVRDRHHEFSGLFIHKYAQMLDIPSKEHEFAIVQVARGHRRTDLFDPEEYPSVLEVPSGNEVELPYLAALIRLADEIDVVTDRNPKLLYDIEVLTDSFQIDEHRRLEAVQSMKVLPDRFILDAYTDDDALWFAIEKMVKKMQDTLDYCRQVVELRSSCTITQKLVELNRIDAEKPREE